MSSVSRRRRLVKMDKTCLWHPFTQMSEWSEEMPVIVTEGRGTFLKDIFGRWYIDGVSSIWVTVHGHRKKELDTAIKQQVDKVSHSTLLGLTHPPAVELAEKLLKTVHTAFSGSQNPLSRVFYSDNGSTAVEIGIKMAFQYWQHKGKNRKKGFLSLTNAYHGDTLGAVSVGGIDVFHRIFSPLLFKTYRAPSPYCYRCELNQKYPDCKLLCLKKMESIMVRHHREIAGLVIEPLVQGAGGMIVFPADFLKGVRRLCRKYNILMIADEVATGFGRTGTMFACEHENVSPDILCLAKGLTGGYLPLAATITTEKIYRTFLGRYSELKTFFHGHTYTGNQLGCAAALANLALFKKDRTLQKMQKKIVFLEKELSKIRAFRHVGDIRQKGFMVGIELVRDKKTKIPYPLREKTAWKVCTAARKRGLLIRPLGNVIVLMPPLNISTQALQRLVYIAAESIREITEQ